MSKSTSIKEAIARFEKENNVVAGEAEKVNPARSWDADSIQLQDITQTSQVEHLQVDLTAQIPPIDKMDSNLGGLKSCE